MATIFGPTCVPDLLNSGVPDHALQRVNLDTVNVGEAEQLSIELAFFESGMNRLIRCGDHAIIERR
jgi:hypothetical protein